MGRIACFRAWSFFLKSDGKWRAGRRVFLRGALQGMGVMMLGCGLDQRRRQSLAALGTCGDRAYDHSRANGASGSEKAFPQFGPLGDPDALGIRLPEGYRARLVAASGQPVTSTGSTWHHLPDGGACFAHPDLDGYAYISNAEVGGGRGGASALVFSSSGDLRDAYPIAHGLDRPCQGSMTPWGTWLSCEEVDLGRVVECDALGRASQQERLSLGRFKHEGLAYDTKQHHLYMTEDVSDGALYRFVPSRVIGGRADLSSGSLQVARRDGDHELKWVEVPDPAVMGGTPTRYQVRDAARFEGGEGIWHHGRHIVFTTKGDDRVWSYDTSNSKLGVLYDPAVAACPILSGVDQIVGTSSGDLLVAEDGGNMQVVVISPDGSLRPLLRVDGQDRSEITGLAFSPDGKRLYFSSQRGGPTGSGLTYEVTGPFV